MSDEVVTNQEEVKVEEPAEKVSSALSSTLGAPEKDQIEKWKQQFGAIFCSGFSDNELYIWRPLGRAEFCKLQLETAQSEKQVTQLEIEEKLVRSCMLWMSEEGKKSLDNKAGSISTLHEQLTQNSNFFNPQLAAALVIQL